MPREKPAMIRLVYTSRWSDQDEPADLREERLDRIVEQAEIRNRSVGVTGALMTEESLIFQAIEGPLPAVSEIFERICRDLRHRRMDVVEFTQIEVREFGERGMWWVAPGEPLGAALRRRAPDALARLPRDHRHDPVPDDPMVRRPDRTGV